MVEGEGELEDKKGGESKKRGRREGRIEEMDTQKANKDGGEGNIRETEVEEDDKERRINRRVNRVKTRRREIKS
jgi:hypothetical protein